MSVFAGILAAGHGARFQAAGVRTPKALIEVGGTSLVRRSLAAFEDAGLCPVTAVVNEAFGPEVRRHLSASKAPEHVLHVKTTASTLETFATLLELAKKKGAERFVFTTVDAVAPRGELARFAREALLSAEPLVLGVTPVLPEDESPLRVELEPTGIARLGSGPYATAGYYAGRVADVAGRAEASLASGVPSLRAFLTRLSALSVTRGILLATTLDVDTPGDVAMAERALASWSRDPGGVE
jgi:choline kinase